MAVKTPRLDVVAEKEAEAGVVAVERVRVVGYLREGCGTTVRVSVPAAEPPVTDVPGDDAGDPAARDRW